MRGDKRAYLLAERAIGLAARAFYLADFMAELAERLVDRTDHRTELRIGERQETMIGGFQRVGRERFESVGELTFRAFQQHFLFGKAALALFHPHFRLAHFAFPAAGGGEPGDCRTHRHRHNYRRQQFQFFDLPSAGPRLRPRPQYSIRRFALASNYTAMHRPQLRG